MWWYKLVKHWSKRDYVEFSILTWVLVSCTLAVLRTVQGRLLEPLTIAAFSFVMIPVELLVLAIFQKYSSHMEETMKYPSLMPEDFNYEQLLKSDRILLFLYAEWCPFSRNASQHLASLEPGSYKIFRQTSQTKITPSGIS